MQTLTEFPESFAAGTTVKYTRSLADYPANDGWTLAVHLRGLTVEGSADVTFGADITASLPAGAYTWLERVSKAGEVNDPATGEVAVTPNVAAARAGDLQTPEAKILAALIAKRDGRLTADQETVQVDSMAITRIPFELLEELIARYQRIVNNQRAGGAPLKRTLVTFRRPS
jgi:hypothetical protein